MSETPIVRRPLASSVKQPIALHPHRTVVVELDDLCFETTEALVPYAAEYLRTAVDGCADLTGEDLDPTPGASAEMWGITDTQYDAALRYAVGRGVYRFAQPRVGAAEALTALRLDGYEIHYVSRRPLVDDAREQTEHALSVYGFPDGYVTFIGPETGIAAKESLRADVFIENDVDQLERFEALGIPYIAFDQRDNRRVDAQARAESWHDIELLCEIVLGPVPVPRNRRDEIQSLLTQLNEFLPQIQAAREHISRKEREKGELSGVRNAQAIRNALDEEIRVLRAAVERLEREYEFVSANLAHAREGQEQFNAYAQRHPEMFENPEFARLERIQRENEAAGRALQEQAALIKAERSQLDVDRIRHWERAHALYEEKSAIDLYLYALGIDTNFGAPTRSRHNIPTRLIPYGPHAIKHPQMASKVEEISMDAAASQVEDEGWEVVGKLVSTPVSPMANSDLDLILMRKGVEGAELQRQRNNLNELIAHADPNHTAHLRNLDVQLRECERALYKCVEVKWCLSDLSEAQATIYTKLHRGETIIFNGEISDPDRVGLFPGIPFAASCEVIAVIPSALDAALKTVEYQQQLIDALGNIEELRALLEVHAAPGDLRELMDTVAAVYHVDGATNTRAGRETAFYDARAMLRERRLAVEEQVARNRAGIHDAPTLEPAHLTDRKVDFTRP